MSVLIQSGISFKSVKLDINFVIHCFFIVTVGAKIITGFPSLLANSRPNIVFPEPGAAGSGTFCTFLQEFHVYGDHSDQHGDRNHSGSTCQKDH